jgi:hypothetical protein
MSNPTMDAPGGSGILVLEAVVGGNVIHRRPILREIGELDLV